MPEHHHITNEFLAFGLSGYQSRLMAVLINLGSANTLTLAEASGVPRTNIYKVMKDLTHLGLAEPVPTIGSSVWTCAGWEHVLDTIEAHLHKELEIATCGWISWFNKRRLHEALGDLTPAEYETAHYRSHPQGLAA